MPPTKQLRSSSSSSCCSRSASKCCRKLSVDVRADDFTEPPRTAGSPRLHPALQPSSFRQRAPPAAAPAPTLPSPSPGSRPQACRPEPPRHITAPPPLPPPLQFLEKLKQLPVRTKEIGLKTGEAFKAIPAKTKEATKEVAEKTRAALDNSRR